MVALVRVLELEQVRVLVQLLQRQRLKQRLHPHSHRRLRRLHEPGLRRM